MKILILSPYDASSHQYWWKGLVDQFVEHECTVVSLPARYFSWRSRGNSLTLSQDPRLLEAYELIIATSMTDLSALRGMRPEIVLIPTVLYFHENQFAYPDLGNQDHLIERQITSLYSALAADALVFNSEFNRGSFLSGVDTLLKKLPDGIPPGITEKLSNKSQVISVALRPLSYSGESVAQKEREKENGPFSIVWNHRWEHDKGVDELATLVFLLLESDIEFSFHLIGQEFRQIPSGIKTSLKLLEANDRLGRSGFIEDRREYQCLLLESQVVLSTARHEFQGLAVLEAMQAGCTPVVPDALAYQEFVPKENRYSNLREAVTLVEQRYHADKSSKPRAFPSIKPSVKASVKPSAKERTLSTIATLPEGVSQEVVFQAWHSLMTDLRIPL